MSSTLGTTRLTLRPGVPVLTRSPGVLQVGLDGPTVRLPDEPAVRRLLALLDGPGGLCTDAVPCDGPSGAEEAARAALDRLDHAGLVVAASDRDPATRTLSAQFGADAARRRTAYASATVVVDADPALTSATDRALREAGLRGVPADKAPSAPSGPPAPRLVVAGGPLARERVDPLVRASIPHLVVAGAAARLRVGPFVEPGRTACLRCVDAHEALADERRPLLIAQAATAAIRQPPPRDPVLDALALAWAVRDLCRYVEGDEPSTWSTTCDLSPAGLPDAVRWGRHPDCGCAWDAVLVLA